jgi:glutamate/tyrosine decarboxylase-like PLP-dependent enzyme
VDEAGVAGAPEVRVVVPETVHITVLKALRVLGFGAAGIVRAPCDRHGRVDPEQLPPLDARTLLVLQAGEVNTGEFDPFDPLVDRAHRDGAWVHVDGAFGLWARASRQSRYLTSGVEAADSWTCDGHKWLNTPYDGAMAICRDPVALSGAMNADAPYAVSEPGAQKNLVLEFSRRARGVPIWAALTALGREGIEDLVESHRGYARTLADGLQTAGFQVLNRVVLNQVLLRSEDDEQTMAVARRVQERGQVWFGTTRWQGRPAIRLSVSSWRTQEDDVLLLMEELIGARASCAGSTRTAT